MTHFAVLDVDLPVERCVGEHPESGLFLTQLPYVVELVGFQTLLLCRRLGDRNCIRVQRALAAVLYRLINVSATLAK